MARHLLVEFRGCDFAILDDPRLLEESLLEAARIAGMTILHSHTHKFEPQGVSAFVLLAESHASLHSEPEHGRVFLDIFTCGAAAKPDAALRYLVDKLQPKTYTIQRIER